MYRRSFLILTCHFYELTHTAVGGFCMALLLKLKVEKQPFLMSAAHSIRCILSTVVAHCFVLCTQPKYWL